MPEQHKVRQGETLATIAAEYGFLPETIWENVANDNLRRRRGSYNTLSPGDMLIIPDRTERTETIATGTTHTFRIHIKSKQTIRLEFKDPFGEPFDNVEYTIKAPGLADITGTTDQNGVIEAEVPIRAENLKLHIFDAIYDLQVGHLNAVSSITGVQQRLNQLGFECGRIDGDAGEKTRDALMRFQESQGLTATGILDADTRNKLEGAHDGSERSADPDVEDEDLPELNVQEDEEWDGDETESLPLHELEPEEEDEEEDE